MPGTGISFHLLTLIRMAQPSKYEPIRHDIFVAAQPVPVTVGPIGELEHRVCLEFLRYCFRKHFRAKVRYTCLYFVLWPGA